MLHVQSISRRFGPRTIFENLSWHVGKGVRVGLVGPNGAGKTTLLRILAGVDAPDSGEVTSAKACAIGYLPQEVETLEGGTVLGQVLSGFGEVRRIEEEIEAIEEALAGRPDPDALERLTGRYGDLRHRFEALGGYRLEGEARAILGGLGFASSAIHAPLATLSGGWRMRAALAGHLLSRPDVLLLDEPTNHLDLESLAWIEAFLDDYDGSVVIVSHDRFFLNRVVTGIADLDDGRLTLYTGDYDDYLEEKEARREALLAAKKNQDRQIQQVERFIERFRYKATKARQVQSRIKQLEKVDRIRIRRGPKTIHFAFPQPQRSGAETIRATEIRKAFGETVVYDGASFTARRGDRIALVGPNGAGKTTLLKILGGVIPPDAGTRTLGHNVSLHYYAQHQLEALGPGRTVLEEIETVAPDEMRPRLRTILGAFLFSGDDVDKKVVVLSGGEKARLALGKMLVRPASLLLLDEPTNHLDLRARGVLEEALDQYTGTIVFISHDRYFINRIATSVCEVRERRLDLRPGNYDDYMDRLQSAVPARAGVTAAARGAKRTAPQAPRPSTPAAPGAADHGNVQKQRGKTPHGAGSKVVQADGASRSRAPGRGGGARRPKGTGGDADETGRSAAKETPIVPGASVGGTGRSHRDGSDGVQRDVSGRNDADGAGPKSREQKRIEADERNRRHHATKGFKERLALVEKEIAALELRLKDVEAALTDPALYRDGARAREARGEHKEIQERIAWLYDEWAHVDEALSDL